jgi:hypothetical protein
MLKTWVGVRVVDEVVFAENTLFLLLNPSEF